MSDIITDTDVKARLIQAAEEVFAEKGFKAATIREIVVKANANLAAVNYHFRDKDRLYIEACKHAHTCSGFPKGPPQWPDGMPAAEKLGHFIGMMVHSMMTPASPVSMQLMMREMANPTVAAREIVKESIQPLAFALRDILREIYPTANEKRLIMIGFSVMGQCLFYRQNRNIAGLIFGDPIFENLSAEAVAAHIRRVMFAAIGAGPPINASDLEAPL